MYFLEKEFPTCWIRSIYSLEHYMWNNIYLVLHSLFTWIHIDKHNLFIVHSSIFFFFTHFVLEDSGSSFRIKTGRSSSGFNAGSILLNLGSLAIGNFPISFLVVATVSVFSVESTCSGSANRTSSWALIVTLKTSASAISHLWPNAIITMVCNSETKEKDSFLVVKCIKQAVGNRGDDCGHEVRL